MRYEPEAAHRFDSGAASRFELQGFGELGCESALRFMIALPAATTPFRPGTTSCGPGSPTRATRSSRSTSLRGPHCTFSRLSGVGTKYLVLQRSAIKATNNRRHLVRRGGFHKCEALGLLRLVIANHLDRIRDEIVCGQPLLNVVGSYPDREVAQKYGKAHSVWCLTPLDFLRGRGKRGRKNRISCLPDTNRRQCVVQWHGLQVLAGKAFWGGIYRRLFSLAEVPSTDVRSTEVARASQPMCDPDPRAGISRPQGCCFQKPAPQLIWVTSGRPATQPRKGQPGHGLFATNTVPGRQAGAFARRRIIRSAMLWA